jgi:hypothetical protein
MGEGKYVCAVESRGSEIYRRSETVEKQRWRQAKGQRE